MKAQDLIGCKIIAIEGDENDIQSITIEKDNYHIRICGSEDYPWITFYIDRWFCPKCKIEMEFKYDMEKHHPYYKCSNCGYEE